MDCPIPEKYLSPVNAQEALMNLREWTRRTDSAKALAQYIMAVCRGNLPADKHHYLGSMLTMILENAHHKSAGECARKFGIRRTRGMSLGETILADMNRPKADIKWKREFSDHVERWAPLIELFKPEEFPGIEIPHSNNILTLSIKDHIYTYRTESGELHLTIISDCDRDILIDEEIFNGEAPLYFTDSSHFVSPVFKIKVVRRILEFVLREIGYPSIRIDCKVVFSRPVMLINKDEYLTGNSAGRWNGIEVISHGNTGGAAAGHKPLILQSASAMLIIDEDAESANNTVLCMLIDALAATGYIYDVVLTYDWLLDIYRDPNKLKYLSDTMEIFRQ